MNRAQRRAAKHGRSILMAELARLDDERTQAEGAMVNTEVKLLKAHQKVRAAEVHDACE